MRRLASWILVLGLFVSGTELWAKVRTWTDNAGRTIKADYVRMVRGDVVLKLTSGSVKSIPFSNFSPDDQKYLRDLLAGTDEADQLPPEAPVGGGNAGAGGAPGVGVGGPGRGALPGGAGPGGAFPGGGVPGASGFPVGGGAGAPGVGPGGVPGSNFPGGGNAGGAGGPPGTSPTANGGFPSGPPGGQAGGGQPGGFPGSAPGAFPGGSGGQPGMSGPPGGMPGGMPGMNGPPGGMPGGMPGMNGPPGGMPGGMPGMSGPPGGMRSGMGMGNSVPGAGVPGGMGGGMGPNVVPPTVSSFSAKQCSKCRKEVPSNVTAGGKCPHCGVYFDYDETNGKKSSGWAFTGSRSFGKLIGLGIVVVAGLIGAAWRASRGG